jgi:hypothetical protein
MPVCAEVMDKERTVASNWTWAVVGGALAVLAWRWRWWLGAIVSTLALAAVFVTYQDIVDPFVGPAIRAEAGQGYITHYYWSAAMGCGLHAFAAYNGLKGHPFRRRAV